MKMKIKNTTISALTNASFLILSGISILLIIVSFFMPPTGIIDSSVLSAVGEIFGFAALGTVIKAIDRGVDAEIQHKDTKITIKNDEEID